MQPLSLDWECMRSSQCFNLKHMKVSNLIGLDHVLMIYLLIKRLSLSLTYWVVMTMVFKWNVLKKKSKCSKVTFIMLRNLRELSRTLIFISHNNIWKLECLITQICIYFVYCGLVVLAQRAFGTVLKQLLNDLTRPEITACAELNLLPSLCYSQDLALLGPGLQDVDQHYIEEQVRSQSNHQGNSLLMCNQCHWLIP